MTPRSVPSHRLERPPRLRPRAVRIGIAATAFAVTLVAVLAGIGVIPVQHRPPAAAQEPAATALTDTALGTGPAASSRSSDSHAKRAANSGATSADPTALPAGAGAGRRIVFAISQQRVWLVDASGSVARTYLVSGSLTDNLHPGTYSVYSKSRWAVGVDDSGVMQYFVRFAHGPHAAIGFHSIPTRNGHPLQTRAQLGTPRSHGCIRQALPDAIRLWGFAPVGTKVVVTA